MMSGHKKITPVCARQNGAAAVEFALVAMLFFAILIGILEFGRVLFTWNSAAEATRRGARIAVVTTPASATIKAEMRKIMPDLQDNQIEVLYDGVEDVCVSNLCDYVTVSVGQPQPYTINPLLLPVGVVTIQIPPFTTTLTRESLGAN
jgi:Flp pilus assembly pilin Flp